MVYCPKVCVELSQTIFFIVSVCDGVCVAVRDGVCDGVWLCVWLCMAVCVWLCVTVCVWLCVTVCCGRLSQRVQTRSPAFSHGPLGTTRNTALPSVTAGRFS